MPKLMAAQSVITRLLADKTPPYKMLEQAYLSSFSRYPTKAERERILQELNQAKEQDQRPLIEDMYWALLSSKEFLFNH